MIGQMVKFVGERLPDGWIRATGNLIKRSDYPHLSKAIGNSLEQVGDDRFYLPSGDDRFLLNKELQTNKTWINGERIWRYGFEYPTVRNSTGSDTIDISAVSGVYQYLNVFGFVTNGTLLVPIPNTLGSGSPPPHIRLLIDISSPNITISYSAAIGSGYSGYVFIEYTKVPERTQASHIIKVSPDGNT